MGPPVDWLLVQELLVPSIPLPGPMPRAASRGPVPSSFSPALLGSSHLCFFTSSYRPLPPNMCRRGGWGAVFTELPDEESHCCAGPQMEARPWRSHAVATVL